MPNYNIININLKLFLLFDLLTMSSPQNMTDSMCARKWHATHPIDAVIPFYPSYHPFIMELRTLRPDAFKTPPSERSTRPNNTQSEISLIM